jgi:hypothetical protein
MNMESAVSEQALEIASKRPLSCHDRAIFPKALPVAA